MSRAQPITDFLSPYPDPNPSWDALRGVANVIHQKRALQQQQQQFEAAQQLQHEQMQQNADLQREQMSGVESRFARQNQWDRERFGTENEVELTKVRSELESKYQAAKSYGDEQTAAAIQERLNSLRSLGGHAAPQGPAAPQATSEPPAVQSPYAPPFVPSRPGESPPPQGAQPFTPSHPGEAPPPPGAQSFTPSHPGEAPPPSRPGEIAPPQGFHSNMPELEPQFEEPRSIGHLVDDALASHASATDPNAVQHPAAPATALPAEGSPEYWAQHRKDEVYKGVQGYIESDDPDMQWAGRTAFEVVANHEGPTGALQERAMKEAHDLYAQRQRAKMMEQMYGARQQRAGAADENALFDQVRNTVKDFSAEHGMKKINDDRELIDNARAMAANGNALAQYGAFKTVIKLWDQRVTDADQRQALNANGAYTSALNFIENYTGDAALSDEYMKSVKVVLDVQEQVQKQQAHRLGVAAMKHIQSAKHIRFPDQQSKIDAMNFAYGSITGDYDGPDEGQGPAQGAPKAPSQPAPQQAAPAPSPAPARRGAPPQTNGMQDLEWLEQNFGGP